jgi:N-acetylmuramoyl-L-alanine amidase
MRTSRRYRLNGGKLAGTLLLLAFIAAVIVVVVMALQNAADVEAAAADLPDRTDMAAATAVATTKPTAPGGSSTPNGGALAGRLIVVDAGHGGFDPGAIGVAGTHEADLNLAVAQGLRAELEAQGARVIMTREEDIGLGTTQNESLQERRRIIEESGSDIVISVHMNSFKSDPGVSGPLALFMKGSVKGERLAQAVVDSINAALDTDGSVQAKGDLVVLKSGNQPCVLVECGYLSNKEEENKLRQPDYQQKLAGAICGGAAAFLTEGRE